MHKKKIKHTASSNLQTKLVQFKRVTKVVKENRILSFSALVVIGDKRGVVGLGFGKARDTSQAVEKAVTQAKKNLVRVPILDGTIPHDIKSKFKSTNVLLKRAQPGTGILSGGGVRYVLEYAGYSNVLAKMHGSHNAYNACIATLQALQALETPKNVAERRGITIKTVFNG